MATKAIRFNDKEDQAIKDFLEKNPYFDFSTLARMAIISFIQNPTIQLKPTQLKINKPRSKEVQ